jgi:hypothetical protein
MPESKPTYVTKRVCETCGGSGEVLNNFKVEGSHIEYVGRCGVCNGAGEIMEPVKEPAPIDPKIQEACNRTAKLLLEALAQVTPFVAATIKPATITVAYERWDTINNVLGAIREKYTEWYDNTENSLNTLTEIDVLLKKAGY